MQFLCYVTFSNADSRISIFFSKLRTVVYPPNMAPIGAKLWQNAFQTICNFSFFDAEIFCFGKNCKIFGAWIFFQLSGVLEELWGPKRHGHVLRKKLLPVVRLFLGRLPWRRGKRLNMCWNPRLGTENDFNHLVLWCYDNMIVLGVDCLIEHVKRWCVSCGVGRVRRAGKRLQLIVGRARNSRVLL